MVKAGVASFGDRPRAPLTWARLGAAVGFRGDGRLGDLELAVVGVKARVGADRQGGLVSAVSDREISAAMPSGLSRSMNTCSRGKERRLGGDVGVLADRPDTMLKRVSSTDPLNPRLACFRS
jgi:hypothetical protein